MCQLPMSLEICIGVVMPVESGAPTISCSHSALNLSVNPLLIPDLNELFQNTTGRGMIMAVFCVSKTAIFGSQVVGVAGRPSRFYKQSVLEGINIFMTGLGDSCKQLWNKPYTLQEWNQYFWACCTAFLCAETLCFAHVEANKMKVSA